jgi:hypothetical protein
MPQNSYAERHEVSVGDIRKHLGIDGVVMERLFILV